MLRKNPPVGLLLAAAMLAASAFGGDAEKAGLDPAARREALKAIEEDYPAQRSQYGDPTERRYPVDTSDHIKASIVAFNAASKAEIKAALDKYIASRKAKQAALEQAQEDLRKVLTTRQEAIASLNGLL